MASVFFRIKWQMQMWKHFAIWCGKTWIKPQFHTFMTNDTSTWSYFLFLWNWAKSDLVKEMCVSCSLAWQNLWHDKRQKFWCYFTISMVIKLMEFQVHWIGNIWISKYTNSLVNATFGSWKKLCIAKFVLTKLVNTTWREMRVSEGISVS